MKLCVGSMYRDEAAGLSEWVAYHLAMGCDAAFLVSNDDPGSAEDLAARDALAPYVAEGSVFLSSFPSRGEHWQMECWRHLIGEWGHLTDWLALTDVDAYFYPVLAEQYPAEALPDWKWLPLTLDAYDDPAVSGLVVNVVQFGSSGLKETPEFRTQSFLHRAPLGDPITWQTNYVIRPARTVPPDLHAYHLPRPGLSLVTTARTPFDVTKQRVPGVYDVLRLNHYSIGSEACWARKVARGWPGFEEKWRAEGNKHPLAAHKRAMLDRNEVHDPGMLRLLPLLRSRLR